MCALHRNNLKAFPRDCVTTDHRALQGCVLEDGRQFEAGRGTNDDDMHRLCPNLTAIGMRCAVDLVCRTTRGCMAMHGSRAVGAVHLPATHQKTLKPSSCVSVILAQSRVLQGSSGRGVGQGVALQVAGCQLHSASTQTMAAWHRRPLVPPGAWQMLRLCLWLARSSVAAHLATMRIGLLEHSGLRHGLND